MFRSRRPAAALLAVMAVVPLCGACHRDAVAAKRAFVESGDRYAAAGKYPEAALEYRNAVDRVPTAGDAREKLAEALLKTGDTGRAVGEYVRAADLLPDDIGVQLKAGNLLLLAGRFDDAKARAQKALKKDPRNVEAQILLANALAALKDVDAAVAQIEDALRVDPDRSNTYANLGALELTRGKRDAAEQAFKKAVELDPKSVAAQVALGNFYWLTGRPDLAEQSLQRALGLDPKNPLTNRALADLYLATKRPDAAGQPLETVYEVTKTPSSAFALAEYYTMVGKDASARTLLDSMLGDERSATAATVRLAALDYKAGDHAAAYRRIDGVLAHDSANLEGLLLKANLLLADGKPDAALADAKTATERHPDSTAAFFALGRTEAARRQPDAAVAAFNEVLRLNPRATAAKVALANLHLAQGRPNTSMTFAEEALANEPANGDAQLVLVRDLLARGQLDRARVELNDLMRRFPDSAVVHTQQGMLLGRTNDAAGARREFERALELRPQALEPLAGLVALDLSARDYASARARVDGRLKAGATAPLLGLAARTYAAAGDLASAEAFLRRAIQTDASYMQAYAALGQLFVKEGKLDAAREEFEALAVRSPKSVGAQTMIGLLLEAKGDVGGARARYEHALQIDPDAAVAANNLAWIDAQNGGNLDVALQLAQTAMKGLPDSAEVGDTLGFIYYKKNLAALAVSTLKASVEKQPDNATFQYHLGLAYAAAGDKARARQTLARALSLKADFSGAQDARALLGSLGSR